MAPNHRFDHVLVNSEDRNVFMVVVLDREAGKVHGHRLLDLNREYGLSPDQVPPLSDVKSAKGDP